MSATEVKRELKKVSTIEKAEASAWFFKTGKGQYGYGDKFIGVTVPEQRKIAKKFRDLESDQIQVLLNSEIHEHRLTGLIILVEQFKKSGKDMQKHIFDFYLNNTRNINNWDLVDSSAPYIVGTFLLDKDRKLLYKFARSNNLWEKRIAIVATMVFIDNNDFDDTLAIAEVLLNDDHDLIHKAVGWMLREIGKKDVQTLYGFLDKHAHIMPRTMLRYSIEKLSAQKKKKYMNAKRLAFNGR